jgi:hypothetical protein
MARSTAARILGGAAALLLCAAGALAQSVHEIQPGGDSVAGGISDAADVDRIPVRLVEGAIFSISLKAAKGSALLPTLSLLDVDRTPDAAATALMVASAKGNSITMKNLGVTVPGLRWIEIRSKDGSTGGWTLKTKIKLPKGAAGAAQVKSLLPPVAFEFPCPGNAVASFKVGAVPGSVAVPEFSSLLDPANAAVYVDEPIPSSKGFSLKNVELVKSGRYRLLLAAGSAPDGDVSVKIKWKVPKPLKRDLLETQIVTDPIVTAVDPSGAENSQILPVTVTVAFALPGAQVRFRKTPSVITVPQSGMTVDDDSIDFNLNVQSFAPGIYGVEVENTDGGKHLLPSAFTVTNASAVITDVDPGSGFDNAVVSVDVTGSFISSGATATLVRGGESIPGTGVLAASTSLTASFDLRARTTGLWDLVVANPDAAPTTMTNAFEILNSPPTVVSVSPADNLSSAVVDCTITGLDFDATPSVLLRRSGESDVEATGETWDSSTQVQATFDTTGLTAGGWDLVLTNPDGQSSTLAAAFRISGPVGGPVNVFSPANNADGPPAVCWNATRNEFLVAWVDTDSSGNYYVYVQRLDEEGQTIGSSVSVSQSASSVGKRDVAVAWDSAGDRYLVAWVEPQTSPTSVTSNANHPSYGYTTLLQVLVQALGASNLAAYGSNVLLTDSTAFSGWPMYEFNNFKPSVCYDAKNSVFQVAFTQEWSTKNISGYGYDDFDAITRGVSLATNPPALLTPVGIAYSGVHESQPVLVYDPVGQSVLNAFCYRGSNTSPLEVRLMGNSVGVNSAANLADLDMSVDTDAKRVLLTWTSTAISGGQKTTHAYLANTSQPGQAVGSITAFGLGSGEEHFLARSAYNPSAKEAMLSWTRKTGAGALSVRYRRAATGGASGLTLLGVENEVSSGGGDEATSASVLSGQAGQSVVFWLKTMTFANGVNVYPGSSLSGLYRGKQFWMQRYQ